MKQYYKVIDENTKRCLIATIARDEDIPIFEADGFVYGDVEHGYDGEWYLQGHAPEMPIAEQNAIRIDELKQLLNGTDYQAIKFAEGLISAEDYAPIKSQRQAWRDEINELEKEL